MEFWRGLEDPRSDRIYSSGNQGVKKGPGPRGSRDEEFLLPSLAETVMKKLFFGSVLNHEIAGFRNAIIDY